MSQFAYQIVPIKPDWMDGLKMLFSTCESLEVAATFKTGSISEASGYYLRMLCDQFKPKTIVEVGTYIGKSTSAMLIEPSVQHLYTCDMHNDCLKSGQRLTCFPMTTSTQMLGQLVEKGVKADFFFFDGRLSPADVPLILRLSKWNTVYAFDDYDETPTDPHFTTGKGMANVALLEPFIRDCTFLEPPARVGDLDSITTIAALVPKELV